MKSFMRYDFFLPMWGGENNRKSSTRTQVEGLYKAMGSSPGPSCTGTHQRVAEPLFGVDFVGCIIRKYV